MQYINNLGRYNIAMDRLAIVSDGEGALSACFSVQPTLIQEIRSEEIAFVKAGLRDLKPPAS